MDEVIASYTMPCDCYIPSLSEPDAFDQDNSPHVSDLVQTCGSIWNCQLTAMTGFMVGRKSVHSVLTAYKQKADKDSAIIQA